MRAIPKLMAELQKLERLMYSHTSKRLEVVDSAVKEFMLSVFGFKGGKKLLEFGYESDPVLVIEHDSDNKDNFQNAYLDEIKCRREGLEQIDPVNVLVNAFID